MHDIKIVLLIIYRSKENFALFYIMRSSVEPTACIICDFISGVARENEHRI